MKNPLHKEIKTTPKDFVLWLGVMATLYVSAISLIVLLFEYITILFPDPLDHYVDPYRGAIRFSIASLIVIFPLYIYLTRKINVDARKHPEKRELKVRKWIVYLSLFAAVFTLVVDLIILINTFLGGDLTTAFLLRVLVVFAVIGSVFLYYLYDLRGYWQVNESRSKMVGAVVALVVIISVISGFFIMGSPATQRDLRFDQERVNELSSIQWQLINYWQSKGELPEELSALEDSIGGYRVPTDPETDEAFVYTKTDERSFTLCATFNLESPVEFNEDAYWPKYGFHNGNWQHDAGEVCFEREIDEDLYPVRENDRF